MHSAAMGLHTMLVSEASGAFGTGEGLFAGMKEEMPVERRLPGELGAASGAGESPRVVHFLHVSEDSHLGSQHLGAKLAFLWPV